MYSYKKMSTDFSKVLVKDDRLVVTDSVKYAVVKGGQNVTVNTFNAIAKSTSSLTFNIQVPSEQTLIDRRVMLRTKFTVNIKGTPCVGQYLVNLGSSDALAPFPMHQMFQTIQATINNNSINLNCQDVINAIIRSNDIRELSAYNSLCPTAFDTYYNYSDAVLAVNNPNGSYYNSADPDLQPRGAFGQINSVSGNTVGDGVAEKNVLISFTTTEPLLVSPFIFGAPQSNNQAFYGVQNLNFVFNLAPTASRMFRSGSATAFASATLSAIDDAELLFNFITPHPSDLLPARNVVPYYELPRYITQYSAVTGLSARDISNGVITPKEGKIQSNSIQLSQVPDKLIIFVRKPLGSQTCKDADAFLTIKGISINWNNNSGLLSSATKQDLYRFSREAGYNGTWQEWSGKSYGASPLGGNGVNIPTSGSLLMLDFGKHIQLTEDWYAPGSLGNFNLQFSLDLENYTSTDWSTGNPLELVLITMNSGVFVCERGTSSIFTGLLTKQDVLDASTQVPYTGSEVKRMVGGGWFDKLKSVAGAVLPKALPVAKAILGQVDNPMAQKGAELLGSLGFGRSGGAKSKLASRVM